MYRQYRAQSQEDAVPTVIASTANPYKFSGSVLEALQAGLLTGDDFQTWKPWSASPAFRPLPAAGPAEKPERFTQVIPREGAAAYVLEALGISS